jgi:hypothetical protein
MAPSSINGKPIRPTSPRQVISRSAILILSGILIGTTIGQGSLTGLAFYRFCAGIVGLISYLGLEMVAHGQRKRVLKKRLAAADSNLKSRLSRHLVAHEPKAPVRMSAICIEESSYLPVMVAGG